ncbi:MAG: hypothetical protein ACRESZ_12190 [Methylococcales bacterium]
MIPMIQHLSNRSSRIFLEIFAPISTPFMIWLALANLCLAIGFYRGLRHYRHVPTRKFLNQFSLLLVAITALVLLADQFSIRLLNWFEIESIQSPLTRRDGNITARAAIGHPPAKLAAKDATAWNQTIALGACPIQPE